MARKEIDYSSTLIYKITCKDPLVTDIYVGHTTDFVQRRTAHRQNVMNNECKLYKTIRENGGWINWTMEIINFYNCKNLYEAKTKEQEYFVSLKANLNSIEPLVKPKSNESKIIPKVIPNVKEYVCKQCNIKFTNIKLLNTHSKSCNLQEKTEVTTIALKHPMKYECSVCDYDCNKQSDYNKHLLTIKHKNNTLSIPNTLQHENKCKCGKQYKFRQGLAIHRKRCKEQEKNTNNKHIIELLIKERAEFKNIVLEVMNSIADLKQQIKELNKE